MQIGKFSELMQRQHWPACLLLSSSDACSSRPIFINPAMAEKYNMAEKPVAQTAAMEDNVGPSKQLRACAPKKSDPTEQHLMSYFFPIRLLAFARLMLPLPNELWPQRDGTLCSCAISILFGLEFYGQINEAQNTNGYGDKFL